MKQMTALFEEIFGEEKLIKMIFGGKRKKSQECQKASIRPVRISSQLMYQVEYMFEKKVTHENLSAEDAVKKSLDLITEDFKQINIFLEGEDIQVLAAKPASPKVSRRGGSRKQGSLEHNQKKNYIIADGQPVDFLIRLGVMDRDGRVFKKHYGKFRQINRYLEIVEDVFPYLPQADAPADGAACVEQADSTVQPGGRPLKIIDFGCGKAYLTFAIYYYLKVLKQRNVEIIGLDLKTDVIDFCNKVARDLGYHELKFLMGDIADYTSDHADMVVTLHACDTATDYALINAVSWNTKVILSVPCCQHELFSQIKSEIHQPMLKHGILKDRLTEYLTDGLRGLKLEVCGYDVAMIEFTSLEHTARNIIIKAVKTDAAAQAMKAAASGANTGADVPSGKLSAADRREQSAIVRAAAVKAARAQRQYEELRDFYQVKPTIDKLQPIPDSVSPSGLPAAIRLPPR
ncbi:MAG: SAM-dependent methyltransferase [Firmicutes bacterium]|nr:SAM-dependent methyltransferase [Bacillota bacterium]